MEKIIETKQCTHCQTSFDITDKDREFLDKVSPTFSGKKYFLPAPMLCPDCRQQRRLVWRNERHLYKRACDFTGKDMVSMYSPDKPLRVYDQDIRRSDKRDALQYGRELDFSISMFQQFGKLYNEVPHISLGATMNENSRYVNLSSYSKNCYLIFACEYNENCAYCERAIECDNCIDNTEATKCVNCYSNVNIENCYQTFFSQNCKNCSESAFLYDCDSCQNCRMCVNLRNAKYHILNVQYEKDIYEEKVQERQKEMAQNISTISQKFNEFKQQQIHRATIQMNTEHCLGDYMFLSKNVYHGFDCVQTEDCRYTYASFKVKDVMDVTNTTEQELAYEGLSVGYTSYGCLFVCGGRTCQNIMYCYDCHHSSDLFACVGLRNKQYCILNKQYTKEEYEALVPKIIERMISDGERGEFFSPQLSGFGYNETIAQEYFPLTREEALKQGFNWSDYESPFPHVEKKLNVNELPNIQEVDANGVSPATGGNILNQAVLCEVSGKPFKIIKHELDFCRRHGIPLPRRHPDQRYLDRMSLRNPRKLRKSSCAKCGTEIMTSYHGPDLPNGQAGLPAVAGRKETLYCEACYNKEIY